MSQDDPPPRLSPTLHMDQALRYNQTTPLHVTRNARRGATMSDDTKDPRAMAKNEVSTCVQELSELLSGAKDPVRNVFTAMAVANLASACARAVFREEVGRIDVVEVSPVSPTTYDPTIAAEDQPRVPTPEEEPDVGVRWQIACLIPSERLDRMPTPEEEPDTYVRWEIANRIPSERLDRTPTPEEEPDADVRREIALRIKETDR